MDSTETIGAVTALLLFSVVAGFIIYVVLARYMPVWFANIIAVIFVIVFFLVSVAKIMRLLLS
jgi:uncharacterized protein with PQ loop repeat